MNTMHKTNHLRTSVSLVLTLLLPALVLFLLVRAVRAARRAAPVATYVVTATTDGDDGVCDAHCTLREAIGAANAAAGADSIAFSLPDESTIALDGSPLPAVGEALAIDGGTAVSLTVSGNGASGILQVSSAAAVTITGLTLSDGAATAGSGCPGNCAGALFNDGGAVLLANSRLSDNVAGVGGAVYNLNGSVTLRDSVLRDNATDFAAGGAIYNNGGEITVSNSSVVSNSAQVHGGAIRNDGGAVAIGDSVFSHNTTPFDGGALHNEGALSISNTVFGDNEGRSGGALYSSVAPASAAGSSFRGNVAGESGGAIYLDGGALTLSDVTFEGNSAANGGAVYSAEGRINAIGGSLSSNIAANGGGLYNYNGLLSIDATTFSEQSADDSGAIINVLGTAAISNSTFISNAGGFGGGAVGNYDGQVTVSGSRFERNNSLDGGAVSNSGELAVYSSTLSLNEASFSGGALVNSGVLTISNSTLMTNTVPDGSGGAISGLGGGTITVLNSTLSANEASGNGGGISNASGPLSVLHSTFWGNLAGGSGGGLHNQNGDLSLRNSIFAGSPSGGECSNAGNLVTNLHNLIEDGSCPQNAIGLVTGDPQLGPLQDNGGPTPTHAIPITSPALDAGNNLACTPLLTDQRGALRIVDGDNDGTEVCDIGAFELDVPNAVSDDGPDFRTDEDTPFTTGSVLANDSDPLPGDTLSVASFDPGDSLGTIAYNGDGTFDYDPAGEFDFLRGNQESLTFFTYTVEDSFGLTDTASILIVVTGRNDAPQLQDVVAEAPDDPEDPVVLSGATVEIDQNEPVTLTVDWGDGTVQQFDQGTGTAPFNHSHTYSAKGLYTITVMVTDGDGAMDEVRLRVIVGEMSLYVPIVKTGG